MGVLVFDLKMGDRLARIDGALQPVRRVGTPIPRVAQRITKADGSAGSTTHGRAKQPAFSRSYVA
ncbi:hypothetical protein Tamer19_59000 [Cupriavidus sp. TA19]|nr:hypothetical protein Tamer19_59000 [Cupriavidus sp. TA19]